VVSDVGDLIDEARAAYAEAAVDFMPDTCTIQSPSNTQGSSGGNKPNFTSLYSDIPCRVEEKAGVERDAGGAVTAYTDHEVTMPMVSADGATPIILRAKHRIVVAARSIWPAKTLEVVNPGGGVVTRTCTAVLRNG